MLSEENGRDVFFLCISDFILSLVQNEIRSLIVRTRMQDTCCSEVISCFLSFVSCQVYCKICKPV